MCLLLTWFLAPLCPKNATYLSKQKHSFLTGEAAPDFPQEGRETSYKNRAQVIIETKAKQIILTHNEQVSNLTDLGKAQLGFTAWTTKDTDSVGVRKMIEECSAILTK